MNADSLVQPICVADDLTDLEAILAVARASVRARDVNPSHEAWEQWLAGPFTKTVRRVKRSRIGTLLALPGAVADDAESQSAVAFIPMRYQEFPKPVARAQVSGTDFPRDPALAVGVVNAPVVVAVLDTLTTGKAAAQAAHAAWIAGTPNVLVTRVPAALLLEMTQHSPIPTSRGIAEVRDSGLTEIEPGTLTAVAYERS